MSYFDWGNRAISSTTPQPVNNPSTATLCAEIDSTQLGTANFVTGQSAVFRVSWILSADTNATWQCGDCTSTGLAVSGIEFWAKTGTSSPAQFVTQHELGPNGRLRARIGGSTFTAAVTAFIQAERLT